MAFLHSVQAVIGRTGPQSLIAPVATRVARWYGRGVKRIFREDGIWLHETEAGYFAYPQPYIRLDLSQLNEFTRSVFWWGYQPSAGDTIVDVGAGVGEER